MAPLAQALQVSRQSNADDGALCYSCELDPRWAVIAVPQGGYALGLLVEACIQHQSGTSHVDPIYVSAFFRRATNAGIGQVRVKLLKPGKTFTTLLAELVQQFASDVKGTTKITAHLLFGDLSPPQPGQKTRALAPPSTYARRLPLYFHPGTLPLDPTKPAWARNMHVHIAVDTRLLSHNDPASTLRTAPDSVGGGGVEWGAWCELAHKDDKLTTSSMPFFCDAFVNLPDLLPNTEPAHVQGKSWFPTIAMTIEFKARLPSSTNYSTRTVGVYSESRFLTDPEGRHNGRVEVWTAPSEIGQGGVFEGWRDQQYCIAVADQMALVLPEGVNVRQGTKDSAKL